MTIFNAETVALGPATPTQPALVAELMHATDPHIFGYLHGHDMNLVRSHLGLQWQQQEGLFSHRYATLATGDGELLGLELGYDTAQQARATPVMVEQAMAYMQPEQFAHLATWFEHGRYVLPPLPDDAWYLQNLAVVPAARGRGIGERLLGNVLERSRAAGHRRVLLDLYADNPAQRLYERMGFVVIVETMVRPLLQHGIPLHLRMECLLA